MLAIAALGFCAAQAQVTLEGTKLTDNVSFTLKGGAVSPFQHYAFFKNARGMFGAELRKQLTPISVSYTHLDVYKRQVYHLDGLDVFRGI